MNSMFVRNTGAATLLLAVSLPFSARIVEAQDETRRLLRSVAGASGDDLKDLAAGTTLVRVVESDDRTELTLVHAVRVRAPVDFILERARRQHVLLDDVSGPEARGVFGLRPSEDDLAAMSLDRREIRLLERCRVGDCGHKLEASTIERMHAEIDWDADSVGQDANQFFRRELVAAVGAYMAGGHERAPVYADKDEPLSVGRGLDELLAGAEFLVDLDPAFHRHLTDYPVGASGAIEDRFGWTLEDLGTKTVVSLHHVAIRSLDDEGVAVVAAKRFYANHYLQAGLRVVMIAPATGDPGAADSYVTIVTRLRFDGEIGGIRRAAMERRLESTADATLASVRDHLEAEFLQQ